MIEEPQDTRAALKLYKAMNHFCRLAETREMAQWLASELERLDMANRHEKVDAMFKQRQGACQILEKIIAMAGDANLKIGRLEEAVTNSKLGGRR